MSSPARVKAIKDPEARARAAAKLLASAKERAKEAQEIRDEAARAMLDDGANFVRVASAIGVTRSAVAQRFEKPTKSS